jgi:hypothetical protein
MEESASRRKRPSSPPKQMGIKFAVEDRVVDPRMRSEIVALLARLLLQAARRSVEGEVRDDAS